MNTIPHGLFRAAQVRELDRLAMAAEPVSDYGLMERAGEAALAVLRGRWPTARRLLVLCGAGNNGGDGYVLARLARKAGLQAQVQAVAGPEGLAGAALQAYQDWRDTGGETGPFALAPLQQAELVVDAMLGTGLARPLDEPLRGVVDAINQVAAPVLALDVPSGLSADTGAVLGAAVRAEATVTFIGVKQGLFTGEGPAYCGTVYFDDLQVPAQIFLSVHPSAVRMGPELLPRLLPPRSRTAHKGQCGHVLVVGGDRGMAGAARLAAEAAARTGAGLVSMATRPEHAAVLSAARPELMCHGVEGGRALAALLHRASVVVLGPGLGQTAWAVDLLGAVLESPLPLVMDADGLNLLAREPLRRGRWLLTPHPGEAARLLGTDSAAVQADRFAAVDALVDAFDATVVLKGAGTLVRSPGGATHVCDAGNPGMASGGMGDVLSGVLGALLAQGLDFEDAARAGTYLHAAAADREAAQAGERGLLARDLMPHLQRLANPEPGSTAR